MTPEVKVYMCPICNAILDTSEKSWVFAMRGHRNKHLKADMNLTSKDTAWVRI